MTTKHTISRRKQAFMRRLHYFVLALMLYNTFLEPCSAMAVDALTSDFAPRRYKGYMLEKTMRAEASETNVTAYPSAPKPVSTIPSGPRASHYVRRSNTVVYAADISYGRIGVSAQSSTDSAFDNIFKIVIDEQLDAQDRVFLCYDLYGLDHAGSVARSINDRLSTGGYLIRTQNSWTAQREEIAPSWLKRGQNQVMFGSTAAGNGEYQIRNVRLEVIPHAMPASKLVVLDESRLLRSDNVMYLKGFVRSASAGLRVYVDDQALEVRDGEFEGLIRLNEMNTKRGFAVVKAVDASGVLGQEILGLKHFSAVQKLQTRELFPVDETVTANAYEKLDWKTQAAALNIPDSALTQSIQLSVVRLRTPDLVPMGPGMINVTRGSGFRFLPDGTKFAKNVTISLDYDPTLIPKGYSPKDIKTFYFNKQSKSWVAIACDSVDTENHRIISSTTHFTDYVNGIIQAPESPETESFAPTTMSNIKAADPASQITLIAPPEVSQKGDANIAFPIKIPDGRHGVQPSLSVQYSSANEEGWVAQGWDIGFPSVSIDTRWGVPVMDPEKETNMYQLNGEELMYPPLNGSDWMPNRHYEQQGTNSTYYSTQDRATIQNAIFTPRKQGSFEKIERLGSSPEDYIWKVTSTDGTITWYGGREGEVFEPSVLRDANNNIVHWGIFMSIDVFGNRMQYDYNNYAMSAQTGINENISGGRYYHVKSIRYNGYDQEPYGYEVRFLAKSMREDIVITGRLGIKQVEPYFLDEIHVVNLIKDEMIRKYRFRQGYGKFKKGRLDSITESDGKNNDFYTHTFDYYDDLASDGGDVYFSAGVDTEACNDLNCPDTDGDGVCDGADNCISQPGPASNNGCPQVQCASISFAAPHTEVPIYNYIAHIGFGNSTNDVNPYDSAVRGICQYEPFSVDHITIQPAGSPAQTYTPTNFYFRHGSTSGPLDMCPGYNPYSTLYPNVDPVTRSPDWPNPWTTSWSNWYENTALQNVNFIGAFTYNTAGIRLLVSTLPNYQWVFHNIEDASLNFTSTEVVSGQVVYRNDVPYDNDTFTFTAPFAQTLASFSPLTINESFEMYIDGTLVPGGPYQLPTNFGSLNYALHQLYGNVSLTSVSGGYALQFTGSPSHSIFDLYYAGEHHYQSFVQSANCGNAPLAAPVPVAQAKHSPSKSDLELAMKELEASDAFVNEPMAEQPFRFRLSDDQGNRLVLVKQAGREYWTDLSDNVVTDEQRIEKMKPFVPRDIERVYRELQDARAAAIKESRKAGQQKAQQWLAQYHNNKRQQLEKAFNNHSVKRDGQNSFYIDPLDQLEHNYSVSYSGPIGDHECPGFLNYEFYIPGQVTDFNSAGALLGSSKSKDYTVGGSLGFGVDFSWDTTSQGITLGAEYSHGWDESESLTAMVDINGDGLDDVVFKHGSQLKWKQHYVSVTYDANDNPQITHSFGVGKSILSVNNSINDFYKSDGQSNNWDFRLSAYGFFVGYNKNDNKSKTTVYFADANGDGLMDIVKNGRVFFNHIDSNGIPNFEQESYNTENMLIEAAPVTVEMPEITLENQTPDYDVVRVWEAPADGDIEIDNFIENLSPDQESVATIEMQKRETAVDCGTNISPSGGTGPGFPFTLDLGTDTGWFCVNYDAYSVPDMFTIVWNGHEVTTGFVGTGDNCCIYANAISSSPDFGDAPINFCTGHATGAGTICIEKTSAYPTTATVIVNGPLGGTNWQFDTVCPQPSNLTTSNTACNNAPPCTPTGDNCAGEPGNTNDLASHDLEMSRRRAAQKTNSDPSNRVTASNCEYNFLPICLLYGTKLNAATPSVTTNITNNSSDCYGTGTAGALHVKKGDRIYFRVHSVANGNPEVNWDPKIFYVGQQSVYDQNGIKPYESSYSDGFMISQNVPMAFPGTGANASASFAWPAILVDKPTDDVTFKIVKRVLTGSSFTETDIYSFTCPAGATSIVANSLAPQTIGPNFTQFSFRVTSSSNVDWKAIEWKPKVICHTEQTVAGTSETVTTEETKYPIVDYSLYKRYVCGSGYTMYTIPAPTGTMTLTPNINNSVFNSHDNGTLHLVIKSGNHLIAKRTYQVNNGSVTASTTGALSIPAGTQNLEIGFYTDDSGRAMYDPDDVSLLFRLLSLTHVATLADGAGNHQIAPSQANLYQKPLGQYGPMYRQWGQFMYNPKAAGTTTPLVSSLGVRLLKEELLTVTQQQATAINNSIYTNVGSQNFNSSINDLQNLPLETNPAQLQNTLSNMLNTMGLNHYAFLIATPTRNSYQGIDVERWIGLHNECYAAQNSLRAARMEQAFSFGGDEDTGQGTLNTGAVAISKYSRGMAESVAAGGSFGVVGATGSRSMNASSTALTDYIDLNGDNYPDLVTGQKVQITKKAGGLNPYLDRSIPEVMSVDDVENWGVTASGSFAIAKSEPGAEGAQPPANAETNTGKPAKFQFGGGESSLSISGSYGQGSNLTSKMWADLNGDGLPDMLSVDNSMVHANLNFGNNQYNVGTEWGTFSMGNGSSESFGGGLGFNYQSGSIEAGVSLGRNDSDTESMLVDMNGDGLLDRVNSGDEITATFNRGNRFTTDVANLSSFNLKDCASTSTAGLNATATVSILWPIYLVYLVIPLKLTSVGITGSGSKATNRTKKSISDFDGDGYPDLIEEISSNKLRVYHSRIRRTDLLKTVHNPLGGSFTIDYKVQPVSYSNPHPQWVMTDLLIDDGHDLVNDGKDKYRKGFAYENGHYDRREREFYGYAKVRVYDYNVDDDGLATGIYRTSESVYNNDSYFLNGLATESRLMRADDPSQLYSSSENTYVIKKLAADNQEIDLSSSVPNNFDVGGREGRRTAAVLMTESYTYDYELSGSPLLVSGAKMYYDEKGRITTYSYLGDLNEPSDDYQTKIEYQNMTSLTDKNIYEVPKTIIVLSGGNTYRIREATADPDTGAIIKVSAHIDNSTTAHTGMKYDQYGNLIQISLPPNDNNEAMSYINTYDDDFHKYVVKREDSFGYVSEYEYNTSFDKTTLVKDKTSNKIIYEYDNFGRLIKIIGPKELAANSPYTLAFYYFPLAENLTDDKMFGDCFEKGDFTPVALTRHFDAQHPENPIETLTFLDGLARVVQTKKDIEMPKGKPSDPTHYEFMSVSGKAAFDNFGRVVEQFHPYFEAKECTVNFAINEYAAPFSSGTKLDELNRPVVVSDAAGSNTNFKYLIDQDNFGITAKVTHAEQEQNGSQVVVSDQYTDASGRVVSTRAIGPSGPLWTQFAFNPIGELDFYKDAENLITKYQYDMLGRKLSVASPDSGLSSFTYDKAGNLTKLQTENLSNDTSLNPSDQYIKYEYDYNRVVAIKYPPTPSGPNLANVQYKYGDTGNDTGRLIWQKDATGEQEFGHGSMGEITYNRRIVVGPNIPTRVFEMRFNYDSWNRLFAMAYPDGEKVTYSYDLGGNPQSVAGEVNAQPYRYVRMIAYDYFEQRTYMRYGNNTETFYDYEPDLRRMSNLYVKLPNNTSLFNNEYGYDKVGNVIGISNSAGVVQNNMGGSYSHRFAYDNLNRLTGASGRFEGDLSQAELGNDYSASYNLEMSYNNTHGIVAKQQSHTKNGSAYAPNSYGNSYKYIQNTHKVGSIVDGGSGVSEQFDYDWNGNIVTRTTSIGDVRQQLWDESNRLRVLAEDKSLQHYIYDATGNRILKANTSMEAVYNNGQLVTPQTVTVNGYTTYPSGYLVIDPQGVYSKHYYTGEQRVVSRIGDQDVSIFDLPCEDCKKTQQAQIADLTRRLEKLKIDKPIFKSFKPYTFEEASAAEKNDEDATTASVQAFSAPLYFYHPDHLKSTTFLTDFHGEPYQFFMNLPFGETMAEQKMPGYYQTPYKFTGKELDEETNMYYFGARYYDPRISIWMSVDPLKENYPSTSPYVYCAENPVAYVDPDGRRIYFVPGLGYNPADPKPYVTGFETAAETYLAGYGTSSKTIDGSNSMIGDMLHVMWNGQRPLNGLAPRGSRIYNVATAIANDLIANPLKEGEQNNLVGASQGSVTLAQAAIQLIEHPTDYGLAEGFTIDSLVLVGSPIAQDSELMAKLNGLVADGKIGKLLYDDYQSKDKNGKNNDQVTGLAGTSRFQALKNGIKFIKRVLSKSGRATDPHYNAAQNKSPNPGEPKFADGVIQKLKKDGVH